MYIHLAALLPERNNLLLPKVTVRAHAKKLEYKGT
jgi:hypothetical protein